MDRSPACTDTSARCICCGDVSALPLIAFPGVPASGIFLTDPSEATSRADLILDYCQRCGLATKASGIGLDLDYAAIDRATAQQMPDYADMIVDWLLSEGVARNGQIIEVGANDGSFLSYLAERGFTSLRGIEPSLALAGVARARGFEIDNGYCTTATAASLVAGSGPASAVVCRHTLEHVPAPSDMLHAIATLLGPGGLALIEVPDFTGVIDNLTVHEIWDEHVTYFSRGNLSAALCRHGFDVVRCRSIPFRDTHNLVALARRTSDSVPQVGAAAAYLDDTISAGCASLASRWNAVKARHEGAAPHWPRPVMAIGASHIQTNFIHFAGLAGVVDALIDDDPLKAGTYVMLDAPRPVLTTAHVLATLRSGTLLRTAFPYPAWMDRLCTPLRAHGVTIVDPYAH